MEALFMEGRQSGTGTATDIEYMLSFQRFQQVEHQAVFDVIDETVTGIL